MATTYNGVNNSIFEACEKSVNERNNKVMMAAGVGLAGGVAVTALSERASTASIVITGAYAAARGYVIHENLEKKKEHDILRKCAGDDSSDMTNAEIGLIGGVSFIDAAAVGYLANLIVGKSKES